MLTTRERLCGTDEGPDGTHQVVHGGVLMVAGDSIMQCFPPSLDDVDPRAIGRLEHKLELRILSEPASRDSAFVDGVVVDDEHDTPGAPVSAFELVEEVDEEQGVFSRMLDTHDAPALRVQRTASSLCPRRSAI